MTRLRAVVALGAALCFALPACGGAEPPPPVKRELVPSWPDVLEGTPDIYAVIRPRALKRDGVYGSFWTALLRVAQARGFTRGSTMVEAVEGADEIIIALGRGDDAALVLRGVPASLDPTKINDADGHPLFRQLNDRGRVIEYELVGKRDSGGSVFVLPDRTWVGTLGDARRRARYAFANPMNRPAPQVDADAIAAVRFGTPVVRAFEKHPTYGFVVKKLTSATFTLKPGKAGLVGELAYSDADATAWGEMQTKRLLGEYAAQDEKRFGWLKEAKVAYEGNSVFVRVGLPPRLLEELPNARGSDFGL